jgi:hypothetical protein
MKKKCKLRKNYAKITRITQSGKNYAKITQKLRNVLGNAELRKN